ncbi:MAG: hypothetical protein ACKO0W_00020 [Planctomycetota bacterium]
MTGAPNGFPGGFRVFTVGRDAASRFRVRPPWRARAGAGPLERALVGLLTFLLALPVALLILAIGLVLLVAFLGCAAVVVAFALAAWIVRRILGVPRVRVTGVRANDVRSSDVRTSGGRENVRVLPRQDADG